MLCVEHIGSWVRFPDTLHEAYGHMAAIMGKNNEKFIGMSGGVAVSSGWLALTLLATIYIFCSSSVTFSPLSLGKYCENLTIW